MLQNVGQPIVFSVHFTSAGFWFNPAGGVTVEVCRRRQDTGAIEYLVAGGVAEVGAFGVYHYRFNGTDAAGVYYAIFNSDDAAADKRSLMDRWEVGISTLLQVVQSSSSQDGFAPFNADLLAVSNARFSESIGIAGRELTDWTAITFALKRNPESDEDVDALLTLRISNPPDVSDGIVWHRGKAVAVGDALQGAGTITVESVSPDAVLTISITAAGMNLPTSPDTAPFGYEVDVWRSNTAGDKEQYAAGAFDINQSVLRSPDIP